MTTGEQMLISAVRYALGRQSYIVGVTCEFVRTVKPKLSQWCINILIRDIAEELDRYHDLGRPCGMECDDSSWCSLLEELRDEELE